MRLRFIVAIAALFSAGLAAQASTLTENFTADGTAVLNSSGYDGVTSTPFSMFDPSLGTLASITIDLTGSATYDGDDDVSFSLVTSLDFPNRQLASGSGSGSGSGFNFSADGTDSYPEDLAHFTGTGEQALILDFSNPDEDTLTISDVTGTLTYNYTPVTTTPEPSGLVLLGTGFLGLAGVARRRWA